MATRWLALAASRRAVHAPPGGRGWDCWLGHAVGARYMGEVVSLASPSGMLDKEDDLTHIHAFDKYGFTVNGIHMRGSVLVFPRFTLLWNTQRVQDISPRNIAPVHMIRPRVELLFIGTGPRMEHINPSLYGYLSRKGISVEPMATQHAVAAFNNLVREGRAVAAALVSPSPMTRDDASMYVTSQQAPTPSPLDVRLTQALASDLSADDTIKLLEGASLPPAPVPGAPGHGAAHGPMTSTPEAASGRASWEAASAAISTRYGYPGAGAALRDVSPVTAEVRERAAVAGASLTPAKTAEEYRAAQARKAARRSSSHRGASQDEGDGGDGSGHHGSL